MQGAKLFSPKISELQNKNNFQTMLHTDEVVFLIIKIVMLQLIFPFLNVMLVYLEEGSRLHLSFIHSFIHSFILFLISVSILIFISEQRRGQVCRKC